MLEIVGLTFPLFGLILIGFISGKISLRGLDPIARAGSFAGVAWLNFFVIYVALPAMFFKLLSRTSFGGMNGGNFSVIKFVAIATFSTFVIFVFVLSASFLWSKIHGTRFDIGVATIQSFAGAYGNIGYMGPPLAILAFGSGAIAPAALIFSFDNAMHFTLAPLLMSFREHQSGTRRKGAFVQAGTVIWKVLSHPFILATIAGFAAAASGFVLSGPLGVLLDMLAGAAAPCALFLMGVSAAIRPVKRLPVELGLLVPVKLLLHPLLVFFLLTTFGNFPPIYVQTAVLMAALPAAANVFVLAHQYEVWQERASSAVIISTLVSVFTLPLVLYGLKHLVF